MPRPYRQKSETQLMQVVVTDFDVIESGFRIIVFDEIVLDAGLAIVREEIFPVNGALADVGHVAAILHGLAHSALVATVGPGVFHPVLDVNEREAAGILIEIRERIFSGYANPAEIHFHGDELGIGFGEKKVVRKLSAESLRRLKLEGMIVIAELDAGFFAFFAGSVEEIRGAFPAAGIAALLFVNPGTNDVAVADDFGSLKSFRPLFFNDVVADVAGRGNQAVLVEQLANVFRRAVEVSGEFD